MDFSLGITNLSKPLAVGVVAAVGSMLINKPSDTFRILGMDLPQSLILGLGAFGSSSITETTKNYIIPLITTDPLSQTAVLLVQPAITGVSLMGLMFLVNGFSLEGNMVAPFLLGAGSQIIGAYANDAVIMPWMNKRK